MASIQNKRFSDKLCNAKNALMFPNLKTFNYVILETSNSDRRKMFKYIAQIKTSFKNRNF